MKAVVFRGKGKVALENVPEPKIREDEDVIVKLTASAICGTDLHFVRGSIGNVKNGRILGHEGVGVVEEFGAGVRNLRRGDRVVVPSTVACGTCSYCRASYYSKCDHANPKGPESTAFYGGPEEAGGLDGLQAEYVRVPYGNVGLVKIPEGVSDDDAILLSDIFPTAYFGADMASIKPGHSVAVLGCGPVGQLAVASAALFNAGRVFAIDCEQNRLDVARSQGAECIDFSKEDPVKVVRQLTRDAGVDCVIDAVGIDAQRKRPAASAAFKRGKAPQQPLDWAIDMVAKAGHVSVVGVYGDKFRDFPMGKAMAKNLTIRGGDCPHRRYVPMLLRMVADGEVKPSRILSQRVKLQNAIGAYASFAKHQDGWLKVELVPPKSNGSPQRKRGRLVTR